ncbi:MAG: hypothetical protein HC824_11640 [Synechococcales cyanobacterium RM1_1_8]|nr:hypothetical protein [Synechococcales cyanobacterium RM1_1_8]
MRVFQHSKYEDWKNLRQMGGTVAPSVENFLALEQMAIEGEKARPWAARTRADLSQHYL